MKRWKQLTAAALAVGMLAAAAPVAAAQPVYATRGQVADMLLAAADDYHPGLQRGDIIRGYTNGDLDESGSITRAQAMVMLSRAFGDLPEPQGDNARSGYGASHFVDVPVWAQTELKDVLDAGIVAGTTATTFSPNENITVRQMELLIDRVYALEGSNLKDDFYASVNKTRLDSSVILPGYSGTGTFTDLAIQANADVAAIIREAAASPRSEGERKIAALYGNILNVSGRNAAGIDPIQSSLDRINAAGTLEDLVAAETAVYEEVGLNLLMGFGLTVDSKDSTSYMLTFGSVAPALGQSGYANDARSAPQREAYLAYVQTLCELVGRTETQARSDADNVWELESRVAERSLSNQELGDVDRTYNVYTMEQLQALFPNVDLQSVFARTGLKQTDRIVVSDVGALTAAAAFFTEENLETLKSYCRFALAASFGACLNQEFGEAQAVFQQAYYGISGTVSMEDTAAQYVQNLLSAYLGQAYVDRHFSPAAKTGAENMVQDIIDVYQDRIGDLTWMSDTTRAKAIRKLDNMTIKIGYPDQWDTTLDDVRLTTAAQGGSFFGNLVTIQKAYLAQLPRLQRDGVEKGSWLMTPYTVNACYNPADNSIEFPAAILQTPYYDVHAAYEENLGGIGYIIAHEITHAFDNNGAKYDENGNAADWWTAEDYAAFQQLCQRVAVLYDGREAAPGIVCSGALTLSENIADLGAMACITELEGRRSQPDYAALYTAAAGVWCSSYTREMKQYLAAADVHAPDKLRGSLVLQQFPEFYEAFGIVEGDGMWLAPEDRVTIW